MEIKQKKIIKGLIAKSININPNLINDKSTSKDFPKWDSLANVKILLSIEKKFKTKIKPEDTAKLNSVNDIYKLLKI
jgi:acyl carrier protein